MTRVAGGKSEWWCALARPGLVRSFTRAAIFVLVVAATRSAIAHGSADWIMNHPDFGWCCGPKDCFWMEPDEVRVENDHYIVDRFSIRWPVVGSFLSADRRFWACYFMKGTEDQEIKCFFAPKPVTMNGSPPALRAREKSDHFGSDRTLLQHQIVIAGLDPAIHLSIEFGGNHGPPDQVRG